MCWGWAGPLRCPFRCKAGNRCRSRSPTGLTSQPGDSPRAGAPEDVARAVAFFASEFDGFITGAALDINDGVYMA